MANEKLTALGALGRPADEDLLYTVDDPTGTAASRKTTAGEMRQREHGAIFVSAGAASQSLSATTWTKITQFAADGENNLTTPSHSNDKITLTVAGSYVVAFSLSFIGAPGVVYQVGAYLGGSLATACRSSVDVVVGTATSRYNLSATGILAATAAQDLELYVHASAAATFGVIDAQLIAFRVH